MRFRGQLMLFRRTAAKTSYGRTDSTSTIYERPTLWRVD